MIESEYKRIHKDTGIIYILLNTEDRWVDYEVNRVLQPNKLSITFHVTKDVEYMPGEWEEWEGDETEYIDMKDGFEPFKYAIYHVQNKEQIVLLLVPKELLMDKKEWIEF